MKSNENEEQLDLDERENDLWILKITR